MSCNCSQPTRSETYVEGNKIQHKTTVVKATDFPLWRDPQNPEEGDLILISEGKGYRFPIERVLPGAANHPLRYLLHVPRADITVPAGQVLPITVEVGEPNHVSLAGSTKPATLLAIANGKNKDKVLVQGAGFYTFPRIHKYEVGKWYYLGATAGTVSTTGTQKLFFVVDRMTIMIGGVGA